MAELRGSFQKLTDFISPINLMRINDMLSDLYDKFKGGIDYEDLSNDTPARVISENQTAIEIAIASTIQQSAENSAAIQAIFDESTDNIRATIEEATDIFENMAVNQTEAFKQVVGDSGDELKSLIEQDADAIKLLVGSDEASLLSFIGLHADSIQLAVGRIGSNNIVKNGRGNFTDGGVATAPLGWNGTTNDELPTDTTVVDDTELAYKAFEIVTGGFMAQYSIPVVANKDYVFSFRVKGNCVVTVWGQNSGSEYNAHDISNTSQTNTEVDYTDYALQFTAGASQVTCLIEIEASDTVRITDLQICEGNIATEWTPAAGEFYTSGISIYENKVDIVSQTINLVARDEFGNTVVQIDSNGLTAYGGTISGASIMVGVEDHQRVEISTDEFSDPLIKFYDNAGLPYMVLKKSGIAVGGNTEIRNYVVGNMTGVGIFVN